MYFFFSYSRQNNESFRREWFSDLNGAVKELTGTSTDAGFFDQKGLEPGELGVQPTPGVEPRRGEPSVYIQYADASVEPLAQQMRSALQSQNLKTPRIELAKGPQGGEIRYYWSDDLEAAARVKRIVELEAAKQRYLLSLELRQLDAKEFKAPQGLIEVWLPNLNTLQNRLPQTSRPSVFEQRSVNPPYAQTGVKK